MKTLSSALQAHLDAGTTTLAWCWRISRTDGVTLGFTDHDRTLSFDGTEFEPESGLTASEIRSGSDLAIDAQDAEGVLSSERITETNILDGRWDNAEVELWRVNWADTSQHVLMRRGAVGQIRRGRMAFVAEVRSLAHLLGQTVGRTFQAQCDAALGDARCGIDLEKAIYKGNGLVTDLLRDRAFRAAGLAGFDLGWFTSGTMTWTSGANAGRIWVEDECLLLVHDGAGWTGTTPAALQNLALLGLGTTADAANPFSARLNAALWTAKSVAEGGTGDLFYTLNKEASGGDLGLTLQTGFVTKALLGLFGSDRLRLAVSPDGSTFFDGLIVDNATGIVDQPQLPRFKAYTNFDNYVGVDTWTKIGLNMADANDQGVFDAATSRFTAPASGTYLLGATLLYKVNASTSARMRGRLVLNGSTEIRGSMGEISGGHEPPQRSGCRPWYR